jgi:hypothetical protein
MRYDIESVFVGLSNEFPSIYVYISPPSNILSRSSKIWLSYLYVSSTKNRSGKHHLFAESCDIGFYC